ncbi:MAG: tRNA (adenosine(37)-N6)-threonylcarbamoyltransferase complex dimerization subunit type 1 TsaB [Treponema sp.]|jgi:tRNA threonylcarbamoyladenosine biosynthesis protein TsaB|nr:tRNA (adenosine(37)-N6)-threonylcarbamoyltransferase complex dimerization subunit type 1 TsaB [Treponema sp.]
MRVLAIDTAVSVLSLALGAETGLWTFEADMGPRHSEILFDSIDILMKTAGLKPAELEAVACMKGPGSFTGLRIGFAAAKGLALSLGIPLAAVSTLDCMARPFSVWPGITLPLIDAKKNRFFTALYRGGERISGYMDAEAPRIVELAVQALSAAPPGEQGLLLTGPDAVLFKRELDKIPAKSGIFPSNPANLASLDPEFRKGWARDLLEIAKKIDIFNNDQGAVFSGPEYIRKSDAELLIETVPKL